MTRANIHLITPQGKFKFQSNSSAYPSHIGNAFLELVASVAYKNDGVVKFGEPDSFGLSKFVEDCGLTLGTIGNFSYHYDVDFVKQTFSIWDYKTRWVNAPDNWRERGWHCYEGKNNRFGWTTFVKGKKLITLSFKEMVTDVIDCNGVINLETLKTVEIL
jgi:hypothetical protein